MSRMYARSISKSRLVRIAEEFLLYGVRTSAALPRAVGWGSRAVLEGRSFSCAVSPLFCHPRRLCGDLLFQLSANLSHCTLEPIRRLATSAPSQHTSCVKAIAIIPARLASTRLPRKILRDINGRPMLAHVYGATRACSALDDVIVATDSRRNRVRLPRQWMERPHDLARPSQRYRPRA